MDVIITIINNTDYNEINRRVLLNDNNDNNTVTFQVDTIIILGEIIVDNNNIYNTSLSNLYNNITSNILLINNYKW